MREIGIQTILAVLGKTDTQVMSEIGKLQLILTEIGETDSLITLAVARILKLLLSVTGHLDINMSSSPQLIIKSSISRMSVNTESASGLKIGATSSRFRTITCN